MESQAFPKLTEHDYLALERAADFKSEFVDGEMYAMSGGTFRHGSLAVNLVISLGTQLHGPPLPCIQLRCASESGEKGELPLSRFVHCLWPY